MKLYHNSAIDTYRKPLGALKTNESALLRIRAEGASEIKIRIFHNDVGTDYNMEFADGLWCFRLEAPPQSCVLWYFFLADTDEGMYYYGPPVGKSQGEGVLYNAPCPSFQLTVYDQQFDTPDWFKGSVMYQIFPDRFRRGDPDNLWSALAYHRRMGRRTVAHGEWLEPVLYEPLEGEQYYSPCDFYGGDLRGIIQSLDYLHSLGIGVLYLNPIVEAASNHRYDTADYRQVDPVLGSNKDFEELCRKAEERGIHVLLDGVYSHTGSDSRYFNKTGKYREVGAYQGKESPYYNWYTFDPVTNGYKCWWGFDTLPEVNEMDPSWQEYVLTSKNSVFQHWLSLGAAGFRLDVADELPDEVIELMRTTLKKEDSQRVLLGEVWEDATTKRSYDVNRRYALGTGLDSVMNYPFKEAVIAFLLGQIRASELANFLLSQQLNYPQPMYYALMNLLSSHDIPRVRTVLATGHNAEGLSREEQAKFKISEDQDSAAARLQRLAAVLQYTIPGVPAVYYGDEYGMHGFKDPFNRAPLNPVDPATCEFYQKLGRFRKQEQVLQTGYASFLALGEDALAVLRFNWNDRDFFGHPANDRALLSIINRSDDAVMTEIDLCRFVEGVPSEMVSRYTPRRAIALERSGMRIAIHNMRFFVTVESHDYLLLRIE